MTNQLAIRIQNLSKVYKVGRFTKPQSLKETITKTLHAPFSKLLRSKNSHQEMPREKFWAVKDVSFEINKGEIIGIIGHNGSGKSTLLKILARITKPSSGFAEVYGKVVALLEIGTGFHPDLTGRENVFLNGAIIGMSQNEIKEKFDSIVEFSGIKDFLDTPVKYYSSGMSVRLAFSISAFLEAEIILLDEIWAVGDQDFQQKSLKKMHDLITSGATIITVSHNYDLIQQLCSRCILMDHGRLIDSGTPAEVLRNIKL